MGSDVYWKLLGDLRLMECAERWSAACTGNHGRS